MVSVQRHVAVLRSELRPGETERLWIRAERRRGEHTGALLLTDRRLLFSGLGFLNQSQRGWPVALIEHSGVTGSGRDATLALRIAGESEAFGGRLRDLQALAALLGQPVAPMSQTDADQLERLAALHASGAIDAAEFAAAKRRLLS